MPYRPPVRSFGEYELDEKYCELRHRGKRAEIQRKPMDLLIHLVRNRHRVVPKGELFEQVWPEVLVSEAALSSAMRDLRRVLGDCGRKQNTIRTFNGFGFQFVAPVTEIHDFETPQQEDASVVVEVANVGEAPEQIRHRIAQASLRAEQDPEWSEGFAVRLLQFLARELARANDDAVVGSSYQHGGSTVVN